VKSSESKDNYSSDYYSSDDYNNNNDDIINSNKYKQLLTDEELKMDCPAPCVADNEKTLYENFLNSFGNERSRPSTSESNTSSDLDTTRPTTANTDFSDKPPFTPFTPTTLDHLNSEINKTDNEIKNAVNNMDNRIVSNSERDRLSNLLENKEYLVKQHKNHIDSESLKDNADLQSIKNKVNLAEKLEAQVKSLKENLNEIKNKLDQDINLRAKENSSSTTDSSTIQSKQAKDPLENTR
jgi:hypothetical protein